MPENPTKFAYATTDRFQRNKECLPFSANNNTTTHTSIQRVCNRQYGSTYNITHNIACRTSRSPSKHNMPCIFEGNSPESNDVDKFKAAGTLCSAASTWDKHRDEKLSNFFFSFFFTHFQTHPNDLDVWVDETHCVASRCRSLISPRQAHHGHLWVTGEKFLSNGFLSLFF